MHHPMRTLEIGWTIKLIGPIGYLEKNIRIKLNGIIISPVDGRVIELVR